VGKFNFHGMTLLCHAMEISLCESVRHIAKEAIVRLASLRKVALLCDVVCKLRRTGHPQRRCGQDPIKLFSYNFLFFTS